MSGWNLPPGVTTQMIDAQFASGPCECCGYDVDSGECVCPECPECESVGDPECYKKHGLKYNKAQLLGKSQLRVSELEDRINDEAQYQYWLSEQPDDYTE